METLEIELSHLPKLLDEEVRRLADQHCYWGMLQDCAGVFDLDITHLSVPLDAMPDLILRKSNELLSEDQAQAFQRAWTSEVLPIPSTGSGVFQALICSC
jgi:hypothetical protein